MPERGNRRSILRWVTAFLAAGLCAVGGAAETGPAVPSPSDQMVGPLPAPLGPPRYSVDVTAGGGLRIGIGEATYRVVSSYSYPGGGDNRLAASERQHTPGEPTWRVASSGDGPPPHRVTARGAYYSIDRIVTVTPTHVLVKDTITNLTDQVLGIILSNHIRAERNKEHGNLTDLPNRTCFVHGEDCGIAMVPLDDVYRYQCERFAQADRAGLRSDKFGLDKRASYTVQWALYPTASGDYYDFLNAFRRDEGLDRTRVDGSFAFVPRDTRLTRAYVANRGLAYVSLPCLSNVLDRPGLDIEGFEFLDMPLERARLRKNFRQLRDDFPHLKTMFHIAHALYATARPEKEFPDSRIIGPDGRQTAYAGRDNLKYYSRYFTPEQVAQGYRWFAFYPTTDNRFGQAMRRGVDMMLGDEIGCSGMFADGFTHSYGGRYTYDRWDGHTVEIDPRTRTVRRRMGAVNLLAQEALIQTIRRINAKGGVLIANSYVGTRTICRERLLYCLETPDDAVVAHLYLAPTIIALGDPRRIDSEVDLYHDIRNKLRWGALYFYYGEKEVTHPAVTAQMFPITACQWHPGYVKGRERLITLHSGVYGWPEHRRLHFGYRYDTTGRPAPSQFLTTVDETGVRTRITLDENETAVLKHIPVTLQSETPINLIVTRYDAEAIRLRLDGHGRVDMEIRSGAFAIAAGQPYTIEAQRKERCVAEPGGVLKASLELDGPADWRVGRAE